MKFGVREICDVVFKANQAVKIGSRQFVKGQPVLYIDSAKTSTIEGAATTVYATGGKGNSRLIAWEGEKTLTFTVEDALLSPIGFAVLSGAGLLNLDTATSNVMVHCTEVVYTDDTGKFELEAAPAEGRELLYPGQRARDAVHHRRTLLCDQREAALCRYDRQGPWTHHRKP